MQMQSVTQFFDTWNNKPCDFDNAYKNQCVDVFKQFNRDVVGAPGVSGNAVDYWTNYPKDFYKRITNTPKALPIKGDVMIWGTGVGKYGHIAIFVSGDLSSFTSFDQNWPTLVDSDGNGLDVCHYQKHNYNHVLGWLRPNRLPEDTQTPPTVEPITDSTVIHFGGTIGDMTVGAVRSRMNDMSNQLMQQNNTINDLTGKVNQLSSALDIAEENTTTYVNKVQRIAVIANGKGYSWTKINKIKEEVR